MSTENQNFPPDPSQIRQALSGAAGQKLIRLLRSSDPQRLRQALALWQQGDQAGAKAVLGPILDDPQTAELLAQIAGQFHGGA